MKKTFYSILLTFICLVSFAQVPDDVLYIYRNDGEFNAFYHNEVDSIVYSNYDLDSIWHSVAQMQVIYALDSIYKIPLSAIDSVSFCAPEKKYAPKVKLMNELIPYITEAEGMAFHLASNTPSDLIPVQGDVLLYECFDNEMFPMGFAGRVMETGDVISCDSVVLDDIYEQLICFGEYQIVYAKDPSGMMRRRLVPRHIEAEIPLSFSFETSTKYAEAISASASGDIGTTIRFTFRHSKDEPLYIDLSAPTYIAFSLGAEINGDIEGDLFDKNKGVKWFTVPIPSTPLWFSLGGEPTLQWNLKSAFSFSIGVRTDFTLGYKFFNGQAHFSCRNVKTALETPSISGNLSGSLFAGIILDPSIGCPGNILSVSPKTTIGAELSGEFITHFLEDDTYNKLKDCAINLDAKVSVEGEAKISLFNFKKREGIKVLELTNHINSWKLLPGFTQPQIDNISLTKATVSVEPQDKLFPPGATIGLGIRDKKDGNIIVSYCPERYREIQEWPLEKYQTTFDGLTPGSEYEVFPIVELGDGFLEASPTSSFTTSTPQPAKITKFEVNSSTYTRKGFEYKDKTCYFDFAATTTVELGDSEGVKDWGYVYQDTDGEMVYISVKDLGTNTYADSRYNFYRNIRHSTATLYGFSKYADDTYFYDEPKDYDLTYTFHPTGYVGEVIANSITAKSVQFEYGFSDVPRTARCYVAALADGEEIPVAQEVEYAEKDTVKMEGLQPGTTYEYWAYVEYAEETYADLSGKKTFTTSSPVATTGESTNIKSNSAIVACTFQDVPEDGVCGVEYKWDGGSLERTVEGASGTVAISLSGLKSSTQYTYRAFIKVKEIVYYGENKTFTTLDEKPDLSGAWQCTIYKEDGSTLETTTMTLTGDGKATQKDSSYTPQNQVGSWSITESGTVGIAFSWGTGTYHPVYLGESWSGQVDNLSNPTSIEGFVYRGRAGLTEHGTKYKMKMTR